MRLLSDTRRSLDLLLLQVETLRANLLEATRRVRDLSMTDRYREDCALLMGIPGIGLTVAMTILTENRPFGLHHVHTVEIWWGWVKKLSPDGKNISHRGSVALRRLAVS